MQSSAPGRVVTFYSYKGGTGRSMAMANVAWILASCGKRVLTIDWDLEAPGLHRYFHPFLVDKSLGETEGLIDFFVDFVVAAASRAGETERNRDWYRENANILRYAVSLEHEFASGGYIDFVAAGKQTAAYSTRVNSFNWQSFYDRIGGGVFIESFKEQAREAYDYVLIDSRTGVSDTSGICTVQLPDVLVVCFTLNSQGIEGAAAVARSAAEGSQLRRQYDTDTDVVRVLPVPMRIENAEYKKLQRQLLRAEAEFSPFLDRLGPNERGAYWARVQFPYVPYYAYEEILATVGDRPGDPKQLLAAAERLTGYITNGEITALAPLSDMERKALVARYENTDVVVSSAASSVAESLPDGAPSWPTTPQPSARRGRSWVQIAAATGAAFALLAVAALAVRLGPLASGPTAQAAPTPTPLNVATAVSAAVATAISTGPTNEPTPVRTLPPPTAAPTAAAASQATREPPTPVVLPAWSPLAVLRGHRDIVFTAAFSPDGQRVVTASQDRSARLWDARNGSELTDLKGPNSIIFSASFSASGDRLVTAGGDKVAHVWDGHTGAQLEVLSGHDDEVWDAAFAPDGEHVVTASKDGTAILWTGDGREVSRFKPQALSLFTARFDDTGERVLLAAESGSAFVYDARSGERLFELPGRVAVYDAEFSPDASAIVTAQRDGVVRIWDNARVASGEDIKPRREVQAHKGIARSATFSPDGAFVLSAGDDGVALVIDAATGTIVSRSPTVPSNSVRDAQYSPDGRRIILAAADGTARIFAAPPARQSSCCPATPTPFIRPGSP